MRNQIARRTLQLLVLCVALVPVAAASNTWYVDGANGSDSNNCMSPTTACKTIGHAISLASSGDSISVAAATYTENLTVGISLEIVGSGATMTIIDGGGIGTVVTVNVGGSVTISKVAIQDGSKSCNNGGGIYNNGRLTINSSTISGNFALGYGAGVYNRGTLTLKNTTVSGNTAGGFGCGGYGDGDGGGIYSSGTLTLVASTISGNVAYGPCLGELCHGLAFGGGVYNSGTLTVSDSTITGNTATAVGNLGSVADGGGVYNNGTIAISSTTLSGNAATAPFINSGGDIFNSGSNATIQNSIVANNASGGNCSGNMTSNGYNLSSDGTCNFTGPGDLNNTDPKLGTLGNYGGPTQTIPLLNGSPAIDAGNPNGCTDVQGHLLTTDQRGKPRPDKEDSGGCDMGAYERQSD
jgi:hypothetical protein